MADNPEREKKKSLWARFVSIFPGFNRERNESSSDIVDIPAQGLMPGHPLATWLNSTTDDATSAPAGVSTEDDKLLDELPIERTARYGVFGVMARDPTISSAINIHVGQALSSKPGTGEIISIESTSDKEDPIVTDLRDTFKETVNKSCRRWAFNAAVYGAWYIRPYGRHGRGIEHIRSDYYTHPRFIKEYEHGGRLAGYTHAYQNLAREGKIDVIEPWKFVGFKIPTWHASFETEPVRHDIDKFDIRDDDLYLEELVESQEYGSSILEDAFKPWCDLLNGIISMNMSRRNAARLERLVGVPMGNLQPTKAAQLMNMVTSQMKKANEIHSKQALSKGFVQTVVNHIIPKLGDRGNLDISTVEGSPNIEALEDIMFHIKRIGGALGVDPSLIGFGDILSGGLGEGGYFRLSIMAAIKSALIRRAIQDGLEELFNIHIMYKYGKFFLPGQRPWRIVFNSVSTALEREEQENQDSRYNSATVFATLFQMIDPEFSKCDFGALVNFIGTDILRFDEEKVKKIFPPKLSKPGEPPGGPDAGGGDGRSVMESAALEKMIQQFYKEEQNVHA